MLGTTLFEVLISLLLFTIALHQMSCLQLFTQALIQKEDNLFITVMEFQNLREYLKFSKNDAAKIKEIWMDEVHEVMPLVKISWQHSKAWLKVTINWGKEQCTTITCLTYDINLETKAIL